MWWYQRKKPRAQTLASFSDPKRAGYSAWYFIVLNCDSETTLSLEQ